jgi:hypothetical protein
VPDTTKKAGKFAKVKDTGQADGGNAFVPKIGFDFDLQEVDEVRPRERVAYVYLAGLSVSLTVALGYSFKVGDFGSLKDVWGVAGPFAGAIAGYYFSPNR